MAKIDIRRKHGQTPKAAKAAVEKTAVELGKKFGLTHRWEGDTLHFQRSGATGSIAVEKTEVHVTAELGFLLGAMKPMIETEIKRQLDEKFG